MTILYPDRMQDMQVTLHNIQRQTVTFTVSRPWYELTGPRDYLAVFPDEPMKFSPGTRFSYSNGGYILLGVVIEELTGLKYQDYVEQAIFRVIGMYRSGYFAFNQLPDKTALGYIEEAESWRTNIYNLPIIGASDGGAYTTTEDLTTLSTAMNVTIRMSGFSPAWRK